MPTNITMGDLPTCMNTSISTACGNKSDRLPARVRDTAHWAKPVDYSRMQAASVKLLGLHDFSAFCRSRPGATTIRDLHSFDWVDVSTQAEPSTYEAHVCADAFCWSMVRSLVGAVLMIGQGLRDIDFIDYLLACSSRCSDIPVAPAHGLHFVRVDYPEAADLAHRAQQTRAMRILPERKTTV